SVIKDAVAVRIVFHYLTGDIMKYVKNIFLVLTFALSAAAFSTSAMAASGSTDPSAHDTSTEPKLPQDPKLPSLPDICKNWPKDLPKPGDFYKMCIGY
ncbi:hypothetical protein FRL18_11945, partial [Salmonella enterica]|nr:hypothetical protein [Salmonella enterica]